MHARTALLSFVIAGLLNTEFAAAETRTFTAVSAPEQVLFSDGASGKGSWYWQYALSSFVLPKFDTSLGQLNSFKENVSLNVTSARIGFENRTTNLSGYILSYNSPGISGIYLRGGASIFSPLTIPTAPFYPGDTTTLTSTPDIKVYQNYDGVLDYAGGSGTTRSYSPMVAVNTQSSFSKQYQPLELTAVTGAGNFDMHYKAEFYAKNSGWSAPSTIFTEYKYTANASITYNFDRIGNEVDLTLSGNQIRAEKPSYISSGSHATRAALLDSEALPDGTAVKMSFQSFDSGSSLYGTSSGAGEILSDVLQLDGLNGKQFVLQMSYDEALASQGARHEDETFLSWFDEATGSWKNVVLGNSTQGSTLETFKGSFDSYLNVNGGVAQLGDYGVDVYNNTVWAVVDHNSLFAVSAVPVPEPEAYSMMLAGLGMMGFIIRRRKKEQS